jgi:hypothetical protein
MRSWLLLVLMAVAMAAGAQGTHQERLTRAERLLDQAATARNRGEGDRARQLAGEARDLVGGENCPGLDSAAERPTPERLSRARRELGTLRSIPAPPSIGHTSETPAAAPSESRAALDKVLKRPEFRTLEKEDWQGSQAADTVWNRFSYWMGQQGSRFSFQMSRLWYAITKPFRNASPPKPVAPSTSPSWWSGLGKPLFNLAIGLLIGGVLALVGYIIHRVVMARQRRVAPEGEGGRETEAVVALRRKQEPTLWERSMTLADEQWRAGDQREALRTVQRACLVLLDARGVLRYDETRANGEVLRELRRQGRAPVHESLRPVMRAFDKGWYGLLNVTNDEFAVVMENTRRFRDSVVGGSG